MATCPAQVYRPRQPKKTPLYRLVSEHWEQFKAVYEDRFEPHYGPLRAHVIRVVEEFLRCGVLDHGFGRYRCEKCGLNYFAAYSCKVRCFCPSCSKKRQILFGEFVTQEILEAVPHSHANFSIPRRLRRHFYFDRKLLTKLARCAYESLREAIQEACGPVTPGAVSVIQTAGNLLDYNPHIHMIITSGGWLETGLFFHAPPLPDDVLEELFKHRVFRMLMDQDAISEDIVEGMLQWHHSGFDAYIGEEIHSEDKHALDNLAQYIAKSPISLQRLAYSRESRETSYHSDKYHPRHGQCRTFDPLDFLAELIMHIAQPYERLSNYHGHYSNRSRGKRKKDQHALQLSQPNKQTQSSEPASPSRKSWARLIKKIYEIDPLVCPKCAGPLKLVSLIDDPEAIYKILKHCNLLGNEQEPRPPPSELYYVPYE